MIAAAAALAAALGGCGVPESTTRSVDEVARQFMAAVERGDGGLACSLLTPEAAGSVGSGDQTCVEAFGDLDLPRGGSVRRTEVWSDEAQVQTGVDTLFVTNLSSGWRVAAAGCTARPPRPYDCEVQG
jgi:hypothetical protein